MAISEWLQNIALLILVYAIRMNKLALFHNYEINKEHHPNPLPNFNCQLAKGFVEGKYMASEDVEIDYENKLAFVSVGLRNNNKGLHKLWSKQQPSQVDADFTGVYVYHDIEKIDEPVKIPIPDSSPHGLSLFRLEDKQHIRVFLTSHERTTSSGNTAGQEEIIYFDYNFLEKSVKNGKFSRVSDPTGKILWASNDLVATTKNSLIVSQYLPFRDALENEWKSSLLTLLTLTDYTAISYVEFEEPGAETEQIQINPERSKIIANYIPFANGIQYSYQTRRIYVNHFTKSRTALYHWNHLFPTEPCKADKYITYGKGFFPDNLNFDENKKFLYVAGTNNIGRTAFIKKSLDFDSVILKVSVEDHTWEPIYEDRTGEKTLSVAAKVSENKFLLGSFFKNLYVCGVE